MDKHSKSLILKGGLVGALLVMVFLSGAQPIGLGWAKNSVNSPVFRKNAVTSFNGVQFASYYDNQGKVILAKRPLESSTWEINQTQFSGNVADAHNSISIAVDGNGYVHMAWDHHGHPLRYSISDDSMSIYMGDKRSMVGTLENTVTYPEFFRMPDGNLTFIYRDGWSGNANCVVNKYSIESKSWSRVHDNLISGEGARSAYWQSCVDAKGVLHVSWVWRESADVASNHDMCYARSDDGGATWRKSTGELYDIPITAATAEYILKIPENSELINQTSIYATSEGRPFIATYWTDQATHRPQYQLIYQDNSSAWRQMVFSNRTSTFSLSGGGTKKIPISRPQVVIDDSGDKDVVNLLYRDNDSGSRVSLNACYDLGAKKPLVYTYNSTDFSVGDWEPNYDIDLWKQQGKLDIFVQRMQQGDGETLSSLSDQPVYIWSVPKSLVAVDSFHVVSRKLKR